MRRGEDQGKCNDTGWMGDRHTRGTWVKWATRQRGRALLLPMPQWALWFLGFWGIWEPTISDSPILFGKTVEQTTMSANPSGSLWKSCPIEVFHICAGPLRHQKLVLPICAEATVMAWPFLASSNRDTNLSWKRLTSGYNTYFFFSWTILGDTLYQEDHPPPLRSHSDHKS